MAAAPEHLLRFTIGFFDDRRDSEPPKTEDVCDKHNSVVTRPNFISGEQAIRLYDCVVVPNRPWL
jgi:hypothetical protein